MGLSTGVLVATYVLCGVGLVLVLIGAALHVTFLRVKDASLTVAASEVVSLPQVIAAIIKVLIETLRRMIGIVIGKPKKGITAGQWLIALGFVLILLGLLVLLAAVAIDAVAGDDSATPTPTPSPS